MKDVQALGEIQMPDVLSIKKLITQVPDFKQFFFFYNRIFEPQYFPNAETSSQVLSDREYQIIAGGTLDAQQYNFSTISDRRGFFSIELWQGQADVRLRILEGAGNVIISPNIVENAIQSHYHTFITRGEKNIIIRLINNNSVFDAVVRMRVVVHLITPLRVP